MSKTTTRQFVDIGTFNLEIPSINPQSRNFDPSKKYFGCKIKFKNGLLILKEVKNEREIAIIPYGINEIGPNAVMSAKVVFIPSTVKKICQYAFSCNRELRQIYTYTLDGVYYGLPENVEVERAAFASCVNLTPFDYTDSVHLHNSIYLSEAEVRSTLNDNFNCYNLKDKYRMVTMLNPMFKNMDDVNSIDLIRGISSNLWTFKSSVYPAVNICICEIDKSQGKVSEDKYTESCRYVDIPRMKIVASYTYSEYISELRKLRLGEESSLNEYRINSPIPNFEFLPNTIMASAREQYAKKKRLEAKYDAETKILLNEFGLDEDFKCQARLLNGCKHCKLGKYANNICSLRYYGSAIKSRVMYKELKVLSMLAKVKFENAEDEIKRVCAKLKLGEDFKCKKNDIGTACIDCPLNDILPACTLDNPLVDGGKITKSNYFEVLYIFYSAEVIHDIELEEGNEQLDPTDELYCKPDTVEKSCNKHKKHKKFNYADDDAEKFFKHKGY